MPIVGKDAEGDLLVIIARGIVDNVLTAIAEGNLGGVAAFGVVHAMTYGSKGSHLYIGQTVDDGECSAVPAVTITVSHHDSDGALLVGLANSSDDMERIGEDAVYSIAAAGLDADVVVGCRGKAIEGGAAGGCGGGAGNVVCGGKKFNANFLRISFFY